ncbi:zinc finger domain-containing protein [Streptomyces platensis]|uniref:zinc finger domain-containing protein n=1 Tax=Streptomyces platensis TaxID=58346 RepID=UPI003C2ECD81
MDLVRSWMRRVECPTCKAAAGRACRTAGGRPTNEHCARRDAVGPIPYAKWRMEGLIPEQRTYTIPAVLKESEKARADYSVDTALADGVAVVRMFLADRLGLFLQSEEAMDRIADAVRKLIEVRGPVGTADVVTVLASQVASMLAANGRTRRRSGGPVRHDDPRADRHGPQDECDREGTSRRLTGRSTPIVAAIWATNT